MRAVGYSRMSPCEDGLSPFSLDEQRALIEEDCRQRGWELVDVLEETVSTEPNSHQPLLHEAITRVGEGDADYLVVARLDRIGPGHGHFHFLGYFAERGRHFAAFDTGWDTATPGGAEVARILLHMSDRAMWHANTLQKPRWNGRNRVIARHIPAGSAVLDLGSGAQTLREELPDDCVYQPCDLVDGPGVKHCDFNRGIWPVLDRRYDVAVASGVMEYVLEPQEFIERLPTLAERAILSHVLRAEDAAPPRGPSWPTHMTQRELESAFDECGLRWERVDSWHKHGIYMLEAA